MRITRENLITLGVLAAVGVAYVLTVYRAQSNQLAKITARQNEIRRRSDEDTAMAARVPGMLREIEQMKRRFSNDTWDSRLPRRQELAGFLREISGNLAEEHLSDPSIRPGNPSQGKLYNRLPITMEFQGDFLALAKFLNRVDAMTRLTRVENLSIHAGNKESDPLQIRMGMNIYFTEQ